MRERDVEKQVDESRKVEVKEKEERKMLYRTDLDGLRALSVLAVIASHFYPSVLPGGFIGMDVLFVISGFLIANNVQQQVANGTFSFSEFNARRVLKVFPSLTFSLLVVLYYAHKNFSPANFSLVCWSAISGVLSCSDAFASLLLKSTHFSHEASISPLLHLWAVSLLQQFYTVYPLVTLFILRGSVSLSKILLYLIIPVSTLLAQFIWYSNPLVSFYTLPARIGEFLIGSFLAFHQPKLSTETSQSVGFLGLLLIGSSMFLLSNNVIFPGFLSLIPCTGAFLVILSGMQNASTMVHKFLSSRLLLSAAKISFSAYLVHWPLLAFIKTSGFQLNTPKSFMLATAVLIIAILMHIFIEKPVRQLKWKAKEIMPVFFVIPLILIISISLSGVYFTNLANTSSTISTNRTDISGAVQDLSNIKAKDLLLYQKETKGLKKEEKTQKKDWKEKKMNKKPKMKQLLSPISEEDPPKDLNVEKFHPFKTFCNTERLKICNPVPKDYGFGSNQCLPETLLAEINSERCWHGKTESKKRPFLLLGDLHAAEHTYLMEEICEQMKLKYFLWAHPEAQPALFKQVSERGTLHLQQIKPRLSEFETVVLAFKWRESYLMEVRETVSKLEGQRVVIMGLHPHVRVPDECPVSRSEGEKDKCNLSAELSEEKWMEEMNSKLKSLAEELGATYFDLVEQLCPGAVCPAYYRQVKLYASGHALSDAGAAVVAADLREKKKGLQVLQKHFSN